MMPTLPEILFEDQYKDQWGWDGWKPKAHDDAPDALKKAVAEWLRDIERAENKSVIKIKKVRPDIETIQEL